MPSVFWNIGGLGEFGEIGRCEWLRGLDCCSASSVDSRGLHAVVVAGRVLSTFIRPTPVRRQVRSASSRVAGPPSHHITTTNSSSRQPASRQTPPPSTAATSSRPHPVQPYTPTRLATPNRRSLTIHPPTATRCIEGLWRGCAVWIVVVHRASFRVDYWLQRSQCMAYCSYSSWGNSMNIRLAQLPTPTARSYRQNLLKIKFVNNVDCSNVVFSRQRLFKYYSLIRVARYSRVLSVLDSGAEGPGFRSQPWRCRVTTLGKLFTPIVTLFIKQRNW